MLAGDDPLPSQELRSCLGLGLRMRGGLALPLCDECGIGTQEPACDRWPNNPPFCRVWMCSRGGPPCFGGSIETCECDE